MHGSYRRNFGPENIDELNQSIDTQHEELLKTDDLDKKADFLRYLAGYAMQFLYLVPHSKKFRCKQTERVLHSSAMMICDFDPREASLAFEHLARYSHNLLEQPWRLDFHVVKLTSGFYVHNIAAHIHNAHELLIAMGYVNIDDVTLKLLPSYNIKSLKDVSRDCYVASQECLILSQIWQRVSDQEPDYPLTIGEVFEFRVKHLGDTDTICKTLLSDIRRRQHEFKMSRQASQQFQNRHFVPVDKLIDYDGMDVENSNGYHYPEREREIVKKVLENTKMQHDESHIYDPVCNGRIYNENGHGHGYGASPFSPSANAGSNNFIFPGTANSHYNNRVADNSTALRETKYDRNSLSPMIPQTVASFCSRSPNRNISQSSSPGSVHSRGTANTSNILHSNGHLQFSKVADHEKSRNENSWVEEHGTNHTGRSRKPISAYGSQVPVSGRKGLPVGPYEPFRGNSGNSFEYMDDGEVTGEDVLSQALEYASEINNLVPGDGKSNKSSSGLIRHPQQVVKSGWETDSRSASSASRVSIERDSDKKSASSTDASSWDNGSNYRPSQSDLAEISYPPHHNLEKVSNSRQASINKVISKPSVFIAATPSETRGIKLYSQSQAIGRESYEYESNGYGTQASRHRDNNISEFSNQYSRKSSSSSSPSPHHFTALPRSYDKTDSIDKELKKYLEQASLFDNHSGPKPQSSVVSTSYNQVDCTDAQHRSYVEQQKPPEKVMEHRRPNKQFDEVPVPQSSFVRNRGNNAVILHEEELSKELKQEILRDSGNVVERNFRPHVENSFIEKNAPLIDRSPSPPLELTSNATNINIEQRMDSENTKKCDPERHGNGRVIAENIDQMKQIEPWNCKFCTFFNKTAERICEMCAKSKDFVEEPDELQILTANATVSTNVVSSAASAKDYNVLNRESVEQKDSQMEVIPVIDCKPDEVQCMRCTFVNVAIAKSCEICGFRLREVNSPSRGGFLS